MRGHRDRYDYSYDRELSPEDERDRWQKLAREEGDRGLRADFRADRAMVPYARDAVNDTYDAHQRKLHGEAYERAFRRGYEDEANYEPGVDQQQLGYAAQRRGRTDRRERRGQHNDSENSEDERDNGKRSKTRDAKQFLDNHFDIRSDMGLIAGIGGGVAGAAIGRKIGNESTAASVAGAIAGAVAANALENQWKKHKEGIGKQPAKAGKYRESKKQESGKTKEKKDKR